MRYSVVARIGGAFVSRAPVNEISDAEKNAPVVLEGCADIDVFVLDGRMPHSPVVDSFTVTPHGIVRDAEQKP